MATKEERELIASRLRQIPESVVFGTISGVKLTRDEAIREVEVGSAEGDKIVETQMSHLRRLRER